MKNLDSIEFQKPPLRQDHPFQKQGATVQPQVNLLATAPAPKPSKKKTLLQIILVLVLAGIVILGGMTISKAVNISNKIFVGTKTSFFQKIKEVIRGGSGTKLIGEDLGQINILLLGIGGEGHEGSYLTDTIILAQIRPDLGQIALTSIPRDLWAEMPKNSGMRKINNAFAEGFAKDKSWNTAGAFARQTVEKISGLSIPYFAVVDFKGFERAIDEVGGIDVNVDHAFTDYEYPSGDQNVDGPVCTAEPNSNSSCRYLKVHFDSGPQHLDGKTALQFVRSRHGNNGESSDFARSQRQQKVISAFKEKVWRLNLVTDAGKINKLLWTFADHFHTNVGPGEIFRIYNIIKERNIQTFLSVSLDPTTGLVCPKILEDSGAYVLVTCPAKTQTDIQNFFKNIFVTGQLYREKSVVWLADSTNNPEASQKAQKALQDAGLTVWELPYETSNLPSNIFYQVNPKPATAEFIKNALGAQEVNLPPPGLKIDKTKVDIIVILGRQD